MNKVAILGLTLLSLVVGGCSDKVVINCDDILKPEQVVRLKNPIKKLVVIRSEYKRDISNDVIEVMANVFDENGRDIGTLFIETQYLEKAE